jgi:hypothetical protein
MPYESKPNECGLFENTRNNKSDLTGQIEVVCPHCQARAKFWVDAWRRTSQGGLNFFKVLLKPKQESTARGEEEL